MIQTDNDAPEVMSITVDNKTYDFPVGEVICACVPGLEHYGKFGILSSPNINDSGYAYASHGFCYKCHFNKLMFHKR